ncbi:hypothetical protein LDENG_00172740 [Lucifuga dentata]|nr:hypothetical protein LDENG_00172740 [Lucifuga dentata]
MMGKDYMLAIIIVNYDDNIWTDQNLLLDPDLPSGWRTIKDSTGTYYWHVPTGATQWQHPRHSSAELNSKQEDSEHQTHTEGPSEDRSAWHEDDLSNHDPDSKVGHQQQQLPTTTIILHHQQQQYTINNNSNTPPPPTTTIIIHHRQQQ